MGNLQIKCLGLQPYESVWRAMSTFTDERTATTDDELWLVQHPPVFTQGQAGKPEHLLEPGDIPVVQSDRGGQVTYHGPGQLVAYPLIDLRRAKLGVRDMVTLLEAVAVELFADYGVAAYPKKDAPGVYVSLAEGEAKVASLGLRVRKGCSFHGMSINLDMDLTPFQRINPCGYQGLAVSQLRELTDQTVDFSIIESSIIEKIANKLQLAPVWSA